MTKILFFISEDWYFLSHRRALAEACRAQGWEVVVATNPGGQVEAIRAAGFQFEPLPMNRGGMHPLGELKTFLALVVLLRRQRPDLLHCVAVKPVLYGGLAAWLSGRPRLVAALGGLGYLFTGGRHRLLGGLVKAALRLAVNRPGSRLIVQNRDDFRQMTAAGVAPPERVVLIPGSGVDLAAFPLTPPPPTPPVVFTVVARMLADKGIREAVEAARELKRRGVPAQLRLVGGIDAQNPTSLAESELRAWEREGLLRWDGRRDDIAAVWRESHVALLPSYREGMPKALLEAQACGRPVITTDVEGCREAIEPGREGLLVPVRQSLPLADAMQRLTEDEPLRLRMGQAARQRAERLFDQKAVVRAHLDVYGDLLKK